MKLCVKCCCHTTNPQQMKVVVPCTIEHLQEVKLGAIILRIASSEALA